MLLCLVSSLATVVSEILVVFFEKSESIFLPYLMLRLLRIVFLKAVF